MNTNEILNALLANLGLTANLPETSVELTKKSVEKSEPAEIGKQMPEFCSCRFSDMLELVEYFPNGDAPKENNALYSVGEKEAHWYCPNIPVGFFVKDFAKKVKPTKLKSNTKFYRQKGMSEIRRVLQQEERWQELLKPKSEFVILSHNPLFKYANSVAKKWAFERDWIPTYRYTIEDNEQEVILCVQEALMNGVERSKITKMCFDRLDKVYEAYRDYKKTPKAENINDADRFMYAMLFTGDVNTLTAILSDFDGDVSNSIKPKIDGNYVSLPTEEDLMQYTENDIEQFKKIKLLFDRTKESHKSASEETWVSAQCYALGVPTRNAVKFIYGDKSVGKKKYHRCEVAYSRQANQVFGWLLDELNEMITEGFGDGLYKWQKVLERQKMSAEANSLLEAIKTHGIIYGGDAYESLDGVIHLEDREKREEIINGIVAMISSNPKRALEYLENYIEALKFDRLWKDEDEDVEYLFDDDDDIQETIEILKSTNSLPF